jgi:superfamily II DNA or RNA helicase
LDIHAATPVETVRPRRRPTQEAPRPDIARAPHLRPYQLEAQQAILEHRAHGVRTQLVSLATGLGKSVVIATLPKLLSMREGDVCVVVAHRDELIQQLVDKFRTENPDALVGVEKADQRAAPECSIVVATVQTLAEKRLEEFIRRFQRRIAMFVIDEAHHAAAPSYRAIVDKVLAQRPEAMILGFTATPNRGDGVRLVDVFERIVYTMDARKAIDAGYLVPVKSYAVATATNLDDVASRGGDFVIGQLAAAVNIGARNRRIVAAYQQHTNGLKGLVFTASVEHARDLCEEFVAAGVNAQWASGETPREERERIVRGFRGNDIDVLVNCGLYLEGFDVPSVQVILNARPTKSTTLYTQITGRALRPVDEIANALSKTASGLERRELIEKSAKPAAIILDFVDQAQRHQLVTVPSLYGLPPHIDAQGHMTAQVAEKFEELLRLDPKRAARVRSAEDIFTALVELDVHAEPREIKPTWQAIDPIDHWRLELPAQRTGQDRKGRPIPDFARKWEQWTSEAKRVAPHEDAERFAGRMLNVDPRTVRWEKRRIDVKREGEKYMTLYSSDELAERVIEVSSSLPGALGSAYQRVDEMLSGYAEIPAAPGAARNSAAPAAAAPRPAHAPPNGKRNRRNRNRRP